MSLVINFPSVEYLRETAHKIELPGSRLGWVRAARTRAPAATNYDVYASRRKILELPHPECNGDSCSRPSTLMIMDRPRPDFHTLSNGSEVEMGVHTDDMNQMLQNFALQGSIHFVIKKLRKSQVPEQTLSQSCRLMVPSWFVQKHGDKFHQTVVLRSGMSTVPCRVHLTVVYTSSGIPEIKLGRGWRDFATYNRLVVGDSLIFELRRVSEFAVHIFRATGNPNAVSSSNASQKRSIDSELSHKNGNDDSSAGCSSHQHLAAQRSGGSADGVRDGTAKTREIIGEEGVDVSASHSTLQISSCINLHQVPELENVPSTPILEKHHDSQSSQEPQIDHVEPPISRPDESAQITGIHVRTEFQQPARVSLPSFIQRLVSYNVQDAVGNPCGAFVEVPSSFVMTHGIHLQGAHVQLQGICKESPVRPVTACFHRMHKDGEPLLYLGWGDFVRENVLRAGQELVFTLAAESFFVVREVCVI